MICEQFQEWLPELLIVLHSQLVRCRLMQVDADGYIEYPFCSSSRSIANTEVKTPVVVVAVGHPHPLSHGCNVSVQSHVKLNGQRQMHSIRLSN